MSREERKEGPDPRGNLEKKRTRRLLNRLPKERLRASKGDRGVPYPGGGKEARARRSHRRNRTVVNADLVVLMGEKRADSDRILGKGESLAGKRAAHRM